MIYDFDCQNQIEAKYAPIIKQYLRETIGEPEDVRTQMLEYDFKVGELRFDLKVDTLMSSTTNFFIETESVKLVKKGWLYNQNVDVILYLDFKNQFLYWLDLKRLRHFEPRIRQWPFKTVQNKDWVTGGHTVPIATIAKLGVIRQVKIFSSSVMEAT